MDVFGLGSDSTFKQRYKFLGLDRNPFQENPDAVLEGRTPLYHGHVEEQLKTINRWLESVVERTSNDPLTLIGSIGTGKTRVVAHIVAGINRLGTSERLAAASVRLSDQGFARASLGGLLVQMLDSVAPSSIVAPPRVPNSSAIPLVAAIVHGENDVVDGGGAIRRALQLARASGSRRTGCAEVISAWLRRQILRESEQRELRLSRRIDWEGELIPTVGELLTIAAETKLHRCTFFAFDQLEDLFRPAFSPTARARILTDLRALVDVARTAPIGVVTTWTPDWATAKFEDHLNRAYPALYDRLQRNEVRLPNLRKEHAYEFAVSYVEACVPNSEARWRDEVSSLVETAVAKLSPFSLDKMFNATPRAFLAALQEATETRANQL